MLEEAAKLLDVKENVLEEFDCQDPYNNNNRIQGVICQQGDHRYGALVIFKVNDKDVTPQLIYATPKLHYPFGSDDFGERHYHWPKFVRAYVYEKLDGTSICLYSYADARGNRFVTAKTRLTPVLRQSKFGDFKSLWDEILKEYPHLLCPEPVKEGKYAFCFELYGYRNPILVQYDVPLATKLLFVVNQSNAEISPPEGFSMYGGPPNPRLHDVGAKDDLVLLYNSLREELQQKNKVTEENLVEGQEGMVFYVLTEDHNYVMFKMKPEMIEHICWASGAIDKNSIMVTVKNALENVSIDDLTQEFVVKLLAEEFSDSQIGVSMPRIAQAIEDLKAHMAFKAKVESIFSECTNRETKRDIMRYMSNYFKKDRMKFVFNVLKEMGKVS